MYAQKITSVITILISANESNSIYAALMYSEEDGSFKTSPFERYVLEEDSEERLYFVYLGDCFWLHEFHNEFGEAFTK